MSDLIDRDAAIDLFESYIGLTMKADDAHHQILYILKSLPSAEPEPEWIPVSGRLPKVRTDVLMMFEKNMAVGFYSHGCWNVNTGNGLYTGVCIDEDQPIAWMPLPEPPRMEMDHE